MAFFGMGLFGLYVIGRMLVLGGASADAQSFRRDEQPKLYWLIVAAAVAIDALFFYLAFQQMA